LKKFAPWLVERLKGNATLQHKVNSNVRGPVFDSLQTKAFGSTYVAGIFVNDQNRFDGPVDDSEIDGVVDDICERFNQDEEAQRHELEALPNRRNHRDSPFYDKLPDILIEKPDEYFFKTGLEEFVNINANYGPVPENLRGLPDMNSGQKSRRPLFLASPKVAKLITESDELNLQLIYHLAVRFFESE
jgi:hypothetical protein